jgi:hypothetical protein
MNKDRWYSVDDENHVKDELNQYKKMLTQADLKIWDLEIQNDRLLTRNKVLEEKAEALESRVNIERETSARFARQLTAAKEAARRASSDE